MKDLRAKIMMELARIQDVKSLKLILWFIKGLKK